MIVDIYITERNGSREIRIPWLPEEIAYKSGGTTMATYEIMNKGEVAVPTGSGLASCSWSSTFPGKNRTDRSMLRGGWKSPEHYHKILEYWKVNGTPLRVLVTGFPINMNVILENYEAKAAGGFGDWEYDVSFLEDRDITISSNAAKKTSTKRAAQKITTHTVKSGDTLWALSKKYLGAGSKWKTIYNANKSIIEKTAKKHGKKSSSNGHWIYPGTKLKIPR